MNDHAWYVEHRAAFAARSLDPEDESAFAGHLRECEECRRAVAQLEDDLAWLPMGVSPGSVGAGLKRRLANQALGRKPWQWNRLTTTAAAAAILLAVVAYQAGRQGQTVVHTPVADSLARALGESEAHRLALLDTLSVLRSASLIKEANFQLEDREGGLMIFADEKTHRWNVVVHGLPPAGPDHKYQFWFITDGGMVRGTEVRMDSVGPAVMTMDMPPTGGNVLGAALTVEPMDSSASKPRGKELVHLIL